MPKIILNANENPYNLPEAARQEIADAVLNLYFNRYPELNSDSLKVRLAEFYNVTSNQVSVGNGSDEVLGQLIYKIPADKSLLVFTDDFSMYDYYAGVTGVEVIKYQRDYKEKLDASAFVEFAKAQETPVDLIIFSNPHNPSGTVVDEASVKTILSGLPDVRIVVDEAYGEFYGQTMTSYIEDFDNLYVTKTLSKAMGAAGVRVGVVLSNADNIAKIENEKVPYNVSALNALAATIITKPEYRGAIDANIKQIKAERDKLVDALNSLSGESLYIYPTESNFVLLETSAGVELARAFKEADIEIRDYKDNPNRIRLTVGTPDENQQVIQILKEVIA
ncbi:histidinol-phosphate aminotransferase family protein [Aerococcaceae bacterium DSM 111176]|nr:histidinol-phosphate aminotransferase family protein [Aerococcaceae bacterium DSM 111176]